MTPLDTIKMTPSPFLELTVPVDSTKKISAISIGSNSLAASFTSNDLLHKTLQQWDFHTNSSQTMEYISGNFERAEMKSSHNTCFFLDAISSNGGIFGSVNSKSYSLVKTPYCHAKLSIFDTKGVTLGPIQMEKSKLVFWDLFKMQEVSSANLGWQGRNLCAMVSSDIVVSVQSGTPGTRNLISLWDSRTPQRAVSSKVVNEEERDLYSIDIVQTSKGYSLATLSNPKSTIDLRSIYCINFGEIEEQVCIPQAIEFNDIGLLASNAGKLSTVTKYQPYTEAKKSSEIFEKVVIRSYDLENNQLKNLSVNFEMKFPYFQKSAYSQPCFAFENNKIAVGALSKDGNKEIYIYKV